MRISATSHTSAIRERLREARADRGWSQRLLAEHLGISSWCFISMLETGATAIPISRGPQIADFIGLSPWEVIRAALLEAAGDHLASSLPEAGVGSASESVCSGAACSRTG